MSSVINVPMVRFENLYKLNTPEDSNHFHKLLGFVCLINFGYRYFHYFIYGNMNLDNIFKFPLLSLILF